MRYFDGIAWTNHLHIPGRIPDIGEWLGSTFTVFGKHWRGAVVIALGSTLLSGLVVGVPALTFVNGLTIVDERLEGFSSALLAVVIVAAVLAIVIQAVGILALNRYMQQAHYDDAPTVSGSLVHGLRRFPKLAGAVLWLTLGVIGALVVLAVLGSVSGWLLALGIIAMIPVVVWSWVKLTFLPAAVAAAPKDARPIRTSAGVSEGRFWPVFGRLLLLAILLGVATNIISAGAGSFGSPIDADAFATLEIDGENGTLDDIEFATFIPSTGVLIGALILTSVVQAASRMVSTSAYMRLYLDTGSPSDNPASALHL